MEQAVFQLIALGHEVFVAVQDVEDVGDVVIRILSHVPKEVIPAGPMQHFCCFSSCWGHGIGWIVPIWMLPHLLLWWGHEVVSRVCGVVCWDWLGLVIPLWESTVVGVWISVCVGARILSGWWVIIHGWMHLPSYVVLLRWRLLFCIPGEVLLAIWVLVVLIVCACVVCRGWCVVGVLEVMVKFPTGPSLVLVVVVCVVSLLRRPRFACGQWWCPVVCCGGVCVVVIWVLRCPAHVGLGSACCVTCRCLLVPTSIWEL